MSQHVVPFKYASLLTLINPRRYTRLLLVLLAVGITTGGILVTQTGMPIWGATLITLGLIMYPAIQKWRDDLDRWGWPMTMVSVLIALQGFHTIEHVAQWTQFHWLGWQPKESGGLISPLNAETVHFGWNWSVVFVLIYLFRCRIRNVWLYPLFLWSLAHSLEHLYLFVQYIQYVKLLWSTNQSLSFAQGLPGIFGSKGWLDTRGNDFAATAFVCRIVPWGFKTANRIDVHFYWNMGEVSFMLPYAHVAIRRRIRQLNPSLPSSTPGAG